MLEDSWSIGCAIGCVHLLSIQWVKARSGQKYLYLCYVLVTHPQPIDNLAVGVTSNDKQKILLMSHL